MRIACPSCGAAYQVPDNLLVAGKAVRCARCGHEWAPLPAATESPVAEPTATEPADPPPVLAPREPMRVEAEEWPRKPLVATSSPLAPADEDEESGRPSAAAAAWVGWLLTVVILVGAGWSAYRWRDDIMASWPPSTRVYAALGLVVQDKPPQ